MKVKSHIFILLLSALIPMIQMEAKEKSERISPRWVSRGVPTAPSTAYYFIMAEAEGQSLASARQNCLVNLTTRLEMERGLVINSNLHSTSTQDTRMESERNGQQISYSQTDVYDMEVKENDRNVTVRCEVVDEYWTKERGLYHIKVLYAVVDPRYAGMRINDYISTSARPGAWGLLSIIPGGAQMYKGDIAKGSFFLTTGIAATGGIVLCEATRQAYAAKMVQQPQYALQYSTRANNWETGRNVCVGVAAGLWLWNLIDAFTAKGARRVVVNGQSLSLQIEPTYQIDQIHNQITPCMDFAFCF